jgi:arginyl-tRNA synthetase
VKFQEFELEVKSAIGKACLSLGYKDAEVDVTLPPNPTYGDLSSSVPIRIAKQLSQKPADVAIALASKIIESKGWKYIGGVSPHRGGYLNFTIAFPRFFEDSVTEVRAGKLGARERSGRTVVVEHTNVNPNKALHIGHARNLVLGDSLVRLLRYLGDEVQALNYVDDSGAQVADVIVGFKFLHLPDEAPKGTKFDVYSGDNVYAKVNAEYANDPKLKEKQSLVLKEIEKGTGELAVYSRSIVKRIVAAQLETCWRLGAAYDLLNWESQIVHSNMWSGVFETMKEKGLVKLETAGENKGCWVIPDPETGEQKVVVRSDGTVVYVAKDIPYAAWKVGLIEDPFGYEVYSEKQPGGRTVYSTTLDGKRSKVKFGGADLAIAVIDTRQSYLQRIVAKVLDQLAQGGSRRYLHRAYEVVALSKRTATQLGFEIGGEFAHMSGRKGLYVNVDSMLETLKSRASSETRRRNLSEPDGWVEDVSEAIAVSALRYELLKQDPDKMIVFDISEALRFQGDTGPYLLYTYARAKRILDKTEGTPGIDSKSAAKMVSPHEMKLVKMLSMLDLAAAKGGEYLSPKEVTKFAHELAVAFNEFYENVQVNKEEDAGLRDARLALVDAAGKVLAEAMAMMGVPCRPRI